ncbi:MAG: aspartate/glutamate racemase family protein [Spirochaetales bacterium]|jgi:aspartate/glutamate racemase|nr:aspartate/glutamate racemase family protein [Spirochaetales bacterium]
MKSYKIAAIYTGVALVKPLSDMLKEILPECEFMNILDDSMIADIIKNNGLVKSVTRRLYAYYEAAACAGADLILNTCSSIGDAVAGAREFIPVPIVRIDEAMCREAVTKAGKIAVLGTVPTTLAPTIRLLEKCAAEAGKQISPVTAVAEGAFQAITAGDAAAHDAILAETAKKIASSCEIILLAQGSMARMEEPLKKLTGLPVISSPRPGIQMVRRILEDM